MTGETRAQHPSAGHLAGLAGSTPIPSANNDPSLEDAPHDELSVRRT